MLRIDRLLSLYCFRPLQKLASSSNSAISILMYHSISDDREVGNPYFYINTSVRRFTEQMRFLKENEYTVISLRDALNIIDANSNIAHRLFGEEGASNYSLNTFPAIDSNGMKSKYVVLTFDDGYHDFLTNAWPVLDEFNFDATVFVSTAYIGNKRKMLNGRACLIWSEVRELLSNGVAFGSHTVNHAKLYELQWKEVQRELLESRLRLEDELRDPVTYFAYPYAFPQGDKRFVGRFRQELLSQKYLVAVTTVIGHAQQGSDPLCLKRLPINEGDDELLFRAKIDGAYNWLAWPQYIHKKMKNVSAR